MKLKIYTQKRQWKWLLAIGAFTIFLLTTWFTNRMAHSVAEQERKNLTIWAEAIHKKVSIVNYQKSYFEEIRQEERRRVELLASTYRNMLNDDISENLSFYLDIVSKNKTIPIVLTDANGAILETNNVDFNADTISHLEGKLKKDFSKYKPIYVRYLGNKYNKLYYKDSRLSTDLRYVLEDLTRSFFDEVATNSASVPVIICNKEQTKIFATGNLQPELVSDTLAILNLIKTMGEKEEPIVIELTGQPQRYIYYSASDLVADLRIYPLVQLSIIALLLLSGYILFSLTRNTEQNQVWVGMAKETAHQLGTPISSLLGWVELMKMNEGQQEIALEMEKDVKRLHSVSDRFSKIGSVPSLEPLDLIEIIDNTVNYFRSRTSQKIGFTFNHPNDPIIIPLNDQLFSWVIENLCKNSIDAIEGIGNIDIQLFEDHKQVTIDFSDTGKGIPRGKTQSVFKPGYTSKKRGWGLGLSLVKRIIKDYHHGKVFVKSSVIGEGTTFRIILKKLQ